MIVQTYDRELRFYAFTLLELMIVLAIIAAMVSVVVPYATRSNETLKIRQECLSMAEAIRYMVDLAMDTRRSTRILIDPKSNSYLLEMATGIGNQDYKPIEDFASAVRRFDRNIHIMDTKGFSTEGNDLCLVFDPARPWPNASISLSTGDEIKTITIRGRCVDIEDSAIGQGQQPAQSS